jgi:sulfur-carrier protein
VRVLLPQSLTRMFPGCPTSFELDADSVEALLAALEARVPGIRDRLCDSTPRIRRHINVFVDGERASLSTALRRDTEVIVMTAISGG